jgi:transcriptional regulator GlxA family with amidase domain
VAFVSPLAGVTVVVVHGNVEIPGADQSAVCVLRARLRTRGDSGPEIALGTGFGDLSNFDHAFRAQFGVDQTRFRDGGRGRR